MEYGYRESPPRRGRREGGWLRASLRILVPTQPISDGGHRRLLKEGLMPESKVGPDVLTDPIFTVTGEDRSAERLSLAKLLARLLSDDEIVGFPRLAAEQRGHWWRFLVRCAAKALHDDGCTMEQVTKGPVAGIESAVRDRLRAAAGDVEGSSGLWLLYQPDSRSPGFLQPPTPDGTAPEQARYGCNSMSFLTSAIGSKNHERKVDGGRVLDDEQSVYALIEFQLGAIFGGRGNYASQIMGSASGAGSGSPFMGVRLGSGENETFRHDVSVMLASRDRIRRDSGLRGEIWALWSEAWDGESSLSSQRLDPFFVPLARLVRIGEPDRSGEFGSVWFRASSKARVQEIQGGGNMGDPFAPLVPDASNPELLKVRGTLAGGYGYAEIANLLFRTDAKRPGTPSPSVQAAQRPLYDGRADVRVLFEGTAFEQGKTVGFYQREVLLPPGAASFISDPDPVRATHAEMLARVKQVKSALNGAARILLAGEPKPRDGDAGKISLPADHFDACVDRIYLERLLTAADRHVHNDDDWRWEWARHVEGLALASFKETSEAVPTATARSYERSVRAQTWLRRRLLSVRGDSGDPSVVTPSPESQEMPA